MPKEHEAGGRWIVEPPQPGEISLHMAFGDGVELTDEQQAAMSELLRSLEATDPDVTGHAVCAGQSKPCTKCNSLDCRGLTCGTLTGPRTRQGTEPWNLMGHFTPGIQ
jgi:hypothetical protein